MFPSYPLSIVETFARAYHAKAAKNPIYHDATANKLLSGADDLGIMAYLLQTAKSFSVQDTKKTNPMTEIIDSYFVPTALCRTSFCESALKTELCTGAKQYVMINPAYETFAIRKPLFTAVYPTYEVDTPDIQADKKRRMDEANLKYYKGLTLVPAENKSGGQLQKNLTAAGFDSTKKTVFSWFGHSYFCYRDDFSVLLENLAAICADGSSLLFDFADTEFLLSDDTRTANYQTILSACGEEIRSVFDYHSIEKLLSDHGFLIYRMMSPSEIEKQIISPTGASIKPFPHIHYVEAVHPCKSF